MRHGGHHSAQKSTTTGTSDLSTSRSNPPSFTSETNWLISHLPFFNLRPGARQTARADQEYPPPPAAASVITITLGRRRVQEADGRCRRQAEEAVADGRMQLNHSPSSGTTNGVNARDRQSLPTA